MTRQRFAAAAAVLAVALAAPALAQVGVRSSTAQTVQDKEIVVQGQRKAVMRQLRELIARNRGDQLARFEDKVCPMVIGMPRDWTAIMTRMIRGNIESVGAEVDAPGCTPNGLVIFIDQPAELLEALRKDEPWLLGMTPRQASNFTRAAAGPLVSWHVSDMRGADGEMLAGMSSLTDPVTGASGSTDARITRGITSSRLYLPVRQEMMLGMVVVEKGKTEGRTLRQLADLATMHLLLEVRPSAGAKNHGSILSLFEPRPAGHAEPQRLSPIDRGALAGFYAQRANNLTAAQQRLNIAKAMERGAGRINP